MNHTPEQDLQPRDATIVNEPDPDDEYQRHEPEDNFSLDVRLRMAMVRIANGCGYDQRQLIDLLKDSLKDHQNHVKLSGYVDECVNTFDAIKSQAE